MKKFFAILLSILIVFTCNSAESKTKKLKCNKPIYFFENVQKNVMFGYLDEILQQENFELKKFYPELGFVAVNYEIKKNKPEIVSLDLKQYGNDIYLFMDISKSKTKLEKYIYANLKKHSKNSYLIKDNYFCKELSKDVISINTKRKNYLKEDEYNPFVYQISMKRYVGYKKSIPKIKKEKRDKKDKKDKNKKKEKL